MKTINRYPGVKPYERTDEALFFGRENDIRDLCDLIRVEKLVVLFGKSGYGKSSLINAGVLPRLVVPGVSIIPPYLPVVVRFGEYLPGSSLSPVEMLRAKIADSLPQAPQMDFVRSLGLPESLWLTLKGRQNSETGSSTADENVEIPQNGPQFLFVFDQFEEFFSYPLDQQLDFRSQLAGVLYDEMPEEAREVARTLERDQRRRLVSALPVHSLFAIRSDRLSELDRLRDHLPAILHKRYELKALSREQARDAIVLPARLPQPPAGSNLQFGSPPFEYGDDALEKILNDLSASSAQGQTGVEAFQLQILCDTIEGMVLAGKIPDRDNNGLPDVIAADLPDFSEVYGAYYQRRLDMLSENLREAARSVIEDGLVRLDPATGEGRRLSMDSEALLDRFANIGANKTLLKELENTFLLRRERNSLGGFNYEISHDTLLAPVLRAKRQRMEAEERKAVNKRRRRAVTLLVWGIGLLLAGLGVAVWAFGLYQDAQREREKADHALQKLEKTAIQVVDAFTREANNLIYKLEYAKAVAKLEKAAELEQPTEEYKKSVLEVAFFYNESGNTSEAVRLLDTCGLLDAEKWANKNEDSIRRFIQENNPNWNDILRMRYFPVLVPVPGGEFRFNDKVAATVSTFQMAQTEVTFWQMKLFDMATGRTRQMPVWGFAADNPAVYVSWFEAVAYANWLSRKQGLQPVYALVRDSLSSDTVVVADRDANGYRLPTEAEWEFAAKEGVSGSKYTYSGSNNLDEVAWWGNNSDQQHGVKRTNAVAAKKVNSLALYDMSGNVWEWCWDWYGPLPERMGPDYRGPDSGQERVLRGGSWFLSKEFYFTNNYRFRYKPAGGINVIGFRVVRK